MTFTLFVEELGRANICLTFSNHKMQITRPFEMINQSTAYDVRCSVIGGEHTGQAGALVN